MNNNKTITQQETRRYMLTETAPTVRIITRWLEANPGSTSRQIAAGTGFSLSLVVCQCVPAMLHMNLIHHSGYVRGKDGHPPRTFTVGPKPADCNPQKPTPVNQSPEHRNRVAKEYRQRTVDSRVMLKKLRNTRRDPVLAALMGISR